MNLFLEKFIPPIPNGNLKKSHRIPIKAKKLYFMIHLNF